jgi:hypothetical protein
MIDYSDYEIERRIMIEYVRPILERMEKFDQPEALRLAIVLENKLGGASDDDIKSAAAELRKLFSEKEFHRATASIWVQIAKAHRYRIATLEKNT